MNLETPGLLRRCAPRNDEEKSVIATLSEAEGEAIQKDDIFKDERYINEDERN